MFTGIINHLGKIKNKSESKLRVVCPKDLINKLSTGASIAVDGICLTVVSLRGDSFEIDFMPETARRTNIRYLKTNDIVNLELPVTPNTFLAGHIIQGHIDGLAKLIGVKQQGKSHILKFSIPDEFSKYIVEKGSIAVNGISLTVINIGKSFFTVGIIPHTWDKTMLHKIKLGYYVNIEADILAKYLEKLTKL
ncbi:MAG: riboflavin synthase subunit alpha [Candidatus Levybacteria bacterium RIFCSPHIGHO2_12_FULL_38_12]|nr:MAG: riboflavin synthase subunit alpha [Candidatus Levybacteria bacterium RIFCSPHIGHO2_01_FULL_38_12]OGH22267.1 MAG: riboflavin synthase subunit alpha [Candidatus Levybacteria bacterium RIFCSPHIGHO2_02_FULL_37_18]OGH22687.1 MAG: riboflavin synthase subunit alpha [Candidatus Levybacteria bacterium RIFCSPHIGHO2_12_FULL_38_12]OGH33523.1 MAG: riboflavin synthase subunit alpha [Candidatus Levybacteria bacterium RIFCSPLOWO2_01_FULL_37_20]OGH43385.1 MAG: riboflavin synthase subunit alpha [Candidatu